MNLSAKDKRALMLLAVSAIFSLAFYLWPESSPVVVGPSTGGTGSPENRLAKLRETASTLPTKEKIAKDLTAQLAEQEKGLLAADTAPQAQALLLQILGRLAASNGVQVRATELVTVDSLNDSYARVVAGIQAECRIEQFINLLSDISRQPEALATYSINIDATNTKEKTIRVRLVVAGVAAKKLLPEKKGNQ